MKKIILLLFLGLWCLMGSMFVKADMGSPEMLSYDIVISNVDGAKTIEYDNSKEIIIPYDTKCTVNYESEYKGILQLEVKCGENDTYTINAKDARILKDEYLPTSENKVDKVQQYYVFKDLDMYRGPSFKYEKVGQAIPEETIIDVTHVDTEDEVWGYVEYGGKKGWVYIYWYDENNRIARLIEEEAYKNIIAVKDITKLYKYPNDKKATINVSIPAGTSLKSEYHYPLLKEDGVYYVTYGGVSGWLNANDGVAVFGTSSILVLNDQKIKVYDENYKKVNLDIKKYQIFDYDYKYWGDTSSYRVTYNGKKYFLETAFYLISESNDLKNSGVVEADSYAIKIAKSAPVYDNYDAKKIIGSIKAGEKMKSSFSIDKDDANTSEYMYFFKTSSISGWVTDDYVEDADDEEDEGNQTNTSTSSTMITTGTNGEMANTREKKMMSIKEIVIMCILGAVILAIASVVTIVLINRKKKEKVVLDEEVVDIEDNQNITTEDNK